MNIAQVIPERADGGPYLPGEIVTYETHCTGLVSTYRLFPRILHNYPDGVSKPARGVRRECAAMSNDCFGRNFRKLETI